MDTLATAPPDSEPSFFTAKFYLLPHLKMVVCGTGVLNVITDWFIRINTRLLVRDLCHLDEFAVSELQEIGRQYNLSDDLTATIYHFGWAELEQRFTGFAYRSKENFRSERLEESVGIKPFFDQTDWLDSQDINFTEIAKRQRLIDRRKPPSQRVGIGGEIYMLHMRREQTSVLQLHRFEDYNEEYMAMARRLPG
ncbi:MAG: hypothetical protein AAGH67_01390 [Cyanobacteria bacterium P01_H01_bin.162]